MHEVVALMDVFNGKHMLLQNLQIVGSSQSTVLGEEDKTPSTIISLKIPHPIILSGYLTVLTMVLESYLDDPGDILSNLDPPPTSLKVLLSEIITVFQSADIQCR